MNHSAADADQYAAQNQNIFFPGIIPGLDGQCVSLVKWFLQDLTAVPNPQAARGDARYVGKTLVAQGHAVEVPYDQRIEGDLVCYEYGLYGHIGVILSGNRTFEQNVQWAGVASKIVDGARVWASRIGSMSESWRHDMHIYRINTYKGNEMADKITDTISRVLQQGILGRNGLSGRPDALDPTWSDLPWVGDELTNAKILDIYNSPEATSWRNLQSDPTSIPGINRRLSTPPPAPDYVPYVPPQMFVEVKKTK